MRRGKHQSGAPRGVLLGLAAASLGCTGDTDAAPGSAVHRDTLGDVEYVHHTGSVDPATTELIASVGRMGAAGGDPSPEEFGRIESVIADDEGVVYVADGHAMEVRAFSPDGDFLRRFGRRGRGPGEVEGLHGIAWLSGDTMVVMDHGNARLSLVSSEGETVGQWPWLPLTGPISFLFNGGPGEVYARSLRPQQAGEDGSRSTWIRYTSAGPQDTLDIPTFESRPGTSITCRGNGIGFMRNPYGDLFLSRPAPDVERVLAWTSEYRLTFVDASGDTLRVITRDVEPPPFPDSLRNAVEAEYAKFRERWAGTRCEGEISFPENAPILRDIVFDDAGRLLVDYQTESGPALDVFRLDGVLTATFPLPPDRDRTVRPALRGDRLYLVAKDDLGVQQVRTYRIGIATPVDDTLR